ncbi:MAG: hypothetical protein ACI9KE_003577, partial [Polyangiales bacterium]
GIELDRIEVRIDDIVVFDGVPNRPLELGARVADVQVLAGDHVVAGRVFFADELVAERRVLVQVTRDQGLTVALTRNCRGVLCDDASATCANAVCVDPQCSPETPQFCGASTQCTSTTTCDIAGECGAVECRRGSCLLVDDGRCGIGFLCAGDSCVATPTLLDAGMLDAGMLDAGFDVPELPDAGPIPVVCPAQWGELAVTSAAVLGGVGSREANLSVTPASALLTPVATMDMWVRFLQPATAGMHLMGNETGFGGFSIRVFRLSSGRVQVTYDLENFGYNWSVPSLDDGCWHHIAFIRDYPGGSVAFYQNGERRATPVSIRTTPVLEGEAGLYVGRDSLGTPDSVDVAIHHLRFWNAALTDAELGGLQSARADSMDPRLIAEIPMQSTRAQDDVDYLDAEGSLNAFLGSWEAPIGNAPGVLMTLDELDAYAAGL